MMLYDFWLWFLLVTWYFPPPIPNSAWQVIAECGLITFFTSAHQIFTCREFSACEYCLNKLEHLPYHWVFAEEKLEFNKQGFILKLKRFSTPGFAQISCMRIAWGRKFPVAEFSGSTVLVCQCDTWLLSVDTPTEPSLTELFWGFDLLTAASYVPLL